MVVAWGMSHHGESCGELGDLTGYSSREEIVDEVPARVRSCTQVPVLGNIKNSTSNNTARLDLDRIILTLIREAVFAKGATTKNYIAKIINKMCL